MDNGERRYSPGSTGFGSGSATVLFYLPLPVTSRINLLRRGHERIGCQAVGWRRDPKAKQRSLCRTELNCYLLHR